MNFKLLPALFFACLLLFAGASQAAKVPKVDICHFDEEAGIFEPLAVPGNAVQPHLDHGDVLPDIDNADPLPDLDDECMLIIPPAILAVAYIDVIDDGAGYDPTVDLDIVTVLDSDATPGLSVGDTVEFGAYPTTLDPCPDPSCPNVGAFTTNTQQTVSTILSVSAGHREIATAEGVRFAMTDLTSQGSGHFLVVRNTPSTARILDVVDDITNPAIYAEYTILYGSSLLSPSTPPHSVSRPEQLSDDPFLDVEIY